MARHRSRDLFPTDAPLPAAQLIGRTEVVDSLTDSLAQGLHQVVLGRRRTGKKSVCRAALEQLDAAGAYVVRVDLFALANRAELATALVQAAIANCGPLARGAQRLRSAGRAMTGLAGATLTAKKQMRAVLQDSPRVVALLSGSIDHLKRHLFVPERRAFYRFGATRRLPPIPPAAWHDGLRAR